MNMAALCLLKLAVIATLAVSAVQAKAVCPDGKNQVYCFVSPCGRETCPRYPNATCVDDYCGGCNFQFFVDKTDVSGDCSTAETTK